MDEISTGLLKGSLNIIGKAEAKIAVLLIIRVEGQASHINVPHRSGGGYCLKHKGRALPPTSLWIIKASIVVCHIEAS